MRHLILLNTLLLFLSCSSNKTKIAESNIGCTLESICPDDGTCSIIVYSNQKLEILTDETGSLYYKKVADENSKIVHFQYKKTVEENVQDGHYQEELIFELNTNETSLYLSDESLQNTKMIFGRHCFCKGQAGYFQIKSGKLDLKQLDGKNSLTIEFKASEVPQIISQIKANWK